MVQGRNTIEGLVARYNALTPNVVTTSMTTGPEETLAIGSLWEAEHERTVRALQLTRYTLSTCLDLRISMLLQQDQLGVLRRNDGTVSPSESDDYIYRLMFEGDVQTLLSMINMRDTSNHQVIHLARYPLRPATIGKLELLVEFDNGYRAEHPDAK